jgi:hypothetical protein
LKFDDLLWDPVSLSCGFESVFNGVSGSGYKKASCKKKFHDFEEPDFPFEMLEA